MVALRTAWMRAWWSGSNQIHAMLKKTTARRHPALSAQIASLPMFARYQVGDCRIGVVQW